MGMATPPAKMRAGALCALLVAMGAVTFWAHQRPGESVSARHSSDSSASEPPTAANAWPFVRGPDYDGRSSETDLVETWGPDGPAVLWSRKLGQGYSSIVVSGTRAYTQYQTLAGQFVVCLEAETGQTVWEYRYDWPYEAAGVYPGPRATPTLTDGRVYFAGPSGLVGCLSEAGVRIWSINVVEQFGGRGAGFGYSCSPVVADGRVFLPVGGPGAALVALDARDGSTVWQSGEDSGSYTPAMPISVAGHLQVLGYLENALVAFDRQDGRVLWRKELSQGYDEHAAWPIYSEPYLWISSPFRAGCELLRLSGGANAGVESVWRSRLLSNDICSSVLHEGCLYGFDLKDVQAKAHRPSRGDFRCLDLASGQERWASPATGHANVLLADGKLILFNDRGELILARATPEKYEELARVQVFEGETCWTPPALSDGRLYLRTQSQAACLYLGRPDSRRRSPTEQTLRVADIPRHWNMDLEVLLGVEPEYAFDMPSERWLRDWCLTGLALLAVAAALAGALRFLRRSVRPRTGWIAFWSIAFCLGAAAMTPLSLWRGEFVFTWPVSLFIAFHALLQQVRLPVAAEPRAQSRWAGRIAALCFAIVCVGYYLLCRRLSLVSEWVFLCGFGAAIPFGLAERWLAPRKGWSIVGHLIGIFAGFMAYYWASVAVLYAKY